MSVRSSIFYGIAADGHHWHVWHNGMRSKPGVFVDINKPNTVDEWGYDEISAEPWPKEELADETGAEVKLHLPLDVCAAIGKWAAEEVARKKGTS